MSADVCYRIDRVHEPGLDATVRWDDPELGVAWPLPGHNDVRTGPSAPLLAELAAQLARDGSG